MNGKQLNVQQMNERLPDVPQAPLYHHLNKLLEANIITIIKNKIQGTVEKIYAINEKQINSVKISRRWGKKIIYIYLFRLWHICSDSLNIM
ncbi:hypothetical protein [Metabacillus fastidiosus]|uniref:hypothetical protein n=1 Tax=Metabacillus fastidiosus TaxID=1458 RepID=UPI003D2998DB